MNYPFAKPMHVTHAMFRVAVNQRILAGELTLAAHSLG